jgi:transcriptional regulator
VYLPPAFAVTDIAELHRLIAAIGSAHLVTAHLVTAGGGGSRRAVGDASVADRADLAFDATLLPFLVEPDPPPYGRLIGHLARANPQWRVAAASPVPALAIFSGPQAYVSPSWYVSKSTSGEVVPTWNYVVVHAHGDLVVHDELSWTARVVRRLTERHEGASDQPWCVDDAPPAYVERMLRGVVGVELRVTRLEGKRKLSQNRPAEDLPGVIAGLEQGGPMSRLVADEMRGERATGSE